MSEQCMAALRAADEDLARLIDRIGPPRLERMVGDDPFHALGRSIVYQQLSGKAAGTIYGRVEALLGGSLDPEAVLATTAEALRGAGLSRNKTLALKDLAAWQASGRLPTRVELEKISDEEIVETLTPIRGVGRWTVEMLMMFWLERPDVWPVTDLGVRKGYAALKGLDGIPSDRELLPCGDCYRPFRSSAAWYMWRAAEVL